MHHVQIVQMDVTKYLALLTNDIIGSCACTSQNRLRLLFLLYNYYQILTSRWMLLSI